MNPTGKIISPISVEPFPPGEYIQDELDARGWTQDELAEVMNRTRQHVSRIIKGQTAISSETALELAAAFGTSAELWMNLQTSYELSKAACDKDRIQELAGIRAKVPVSELRKRGWIPQVKEPRELTSALCQFLGLESLNASPAINIARWKSTGAPDQPLACMAWARRALQLAAGVRVSTYRDNGLECGFQELRALATKPEDIGLVPGMLSAVGVRLVIVQPLRGTQIDGGALWLDQDSPVVALSLRFGRIDSVWSNLFHALVHIKHRHMSVVDVDMNGDSKDRGDADTPDETELAANREGANYLIPSEELASFVAQHKSQLNRAKIIEFASAQDVHPGIVVGQLESFGTITSGQYRKLLVDVRQHLINTTLSDGWGNASASRALRPGNDHAAIPS